MKIALYIIGLFACLWIGYYVGKRNTTIPTQEKETIIRIDTLTKIDTLYKEIVKPTYIKEEVVRIDTIKTDRAIEIKQREYLTAINEDSIVGEIRAVISGYQPTLDTLSYNLTIPQRTITIEKETTKFKSKHFNFSVGVGFGYGVINRQADIFVGGMVGYSF